MSQDQGTEDGAVDPRELTKRDWDMIADLLHKRASYFEWKASLPETSPSRQLDCQAAAERRRALAYRIVGIKKFYRLQPAAKSQETT